MTEPSETIYTCEECKGSFSYDDQDGKGGICGLCFQCANCGCVCDQEEEEEEEDYETAECANCGNRHCCYKMIVKNDRFYCCDICVEDYIDLDEQKDKETLHEEVDENLPSLPQDKTV
jgi:hypothetical protein